MLNSSKFRNRYVITIYVAGMRGAVFAKSPKSHEIQQDAIDLLTFEEWKQRMTCGKHMLQLQMEREGRKKSTTRVYMYINCCQRRSLVCMVHQCMRRGKGGGVYISMKCDNKSYRMFKYRYVKQ